MSKGQSNNLVVIVFENYKLLNALFYANRRFARNKTNESRISIQVLLLFIFTVKKAY